MSEDRSSIAEAVLHSAPYWRNPALLAALLALLYLAGGSVFDTLVYDRDAIASGQLWRLFGGHLVHWNLTHLLLNLAGISVWALLCARPWSALRWLGNGAGVALVISVGMLLAWPETQRYAGLSGVLHGLFVLGLAPLALRRDRVAAVCLLFVLFKVCFEQWQDAPLMGGSGIGVRVSTEAHLLGTVAACAMVVWRELFARRAARL